MFPCYAKNIEDHHEGHEARYTAVAMGPNNRSHIELCLLVILCGGLLGVPLSGQNGGGTAIGEWPTYGADLRSTRYSPLDRINAGNFNELEVAWRFKTENLGPRPEFL
ncbi:MAG: hypothetical protein GEV06_29125, partial [Luteitalea sp.]|nr:hypothetical protein [Luteitalea sp.]